MSRADLHVALVAKLDEAADGVGRVALNAHGARATLGGLCVAKKRQVRLTLPTLIIILQAES